MNEDEIKTNDTGSLEATEDEVNEALESGSDETSQSADTQNENSDASVTDASDDDTDDDSDESDDDDDVDFSQFLQVPNVPAPQAAEDGSVDMQAYTRYMQAENLKTIAFAEQERRTYRAVAKKYPEFSSNPALRKLIVNNRLMDVQGGGDGNLMRVADEVFSIMGNKVQEGKNAAKTSVKVQKTAALSTSGPASVSNGGTADLQTLMQSRDPKVAQAARLELLTQWQKDGKI